MKLVANRSFFFIIVLTGAATLSFALENPVSSPIGPPTVPPSSLSNDLTTQTQQYYDADGNLIVTHNVIGDRYFRGVVPYRSVTEFGADLGSDSLNSFIRSSTGQPYYDKALTQTQPYYLPSRTVTSMQRYGQGGLAPFKIEQLVSSGIPILPLPEQNTLYRRQRPLSLGADELEEMVDLQLQLMKEQEEKAKVLPEEDEKLNYFGKVEIKKSDLSEQLETEKVTPQEPEIPADIEQEDIEQAEPSEYLKDIDSQGEESKHEELEQIDEAQEETEDKYSLKLPEKKEFPEPDHAKAKEIRGPHKDFKSLANAKFNEYIQAADKFFKQGKYYRAADAYILAGVWSGEHPLPLIGRGHALFAAGEYMSSSYFIQKAITLDPEYASKKFDLPRLLFDPDMIENRLLEVMTWQQKNGSGELAFLMAYLFYQLNDMSRAQIAINLAIEKMPDNKAVNLLKKAIEAAGSK